MVIQASTLTAVGIDERPRDLAITRFSEGSIVPELAAVPVWGAVSDVLLCNVGTEVEDRPAS